MTPISAIPPTAAAALPNSSAVTPKPSPLPAMGIQMPEELTQPLGTPQSTGGSFSSMLSQMVDDVSTQQKASAQAVSALQSGQNVPLHQAVISMEEANVSFQLMVEVRNRLMDAYQEIMRMQV
ncbi:MAG TPA: flagellar hook-basal body complex protein FliE [Pseudomonadales bacterium]|nr:flagellar hook-basal body complex protein FliE [Pseudomonadales bacterium]